MPRKLLSPRLYLRTRKGRESVYVIKDGEHEHSTGFGPARRQDAEEALSAYIIKKYATPSGVMTPDTMTIGAVLTIYAQEHGPTVASPERIAYAIEAMAPFWAELMVNAIKKETCRAYARYREGQGVKTSTARRELQTLSAALTYCVGEGRLTLAPPVALPPKSEPRDRWLTRDEAAALIRAARRTGNHHLARFILIGLYTGTRKAAILSLQWMPNFSGGHVDLNKSHMYRASATARATNKRQPPIKIPRKLLLHMRCWHSDTRQFVIEWRGERVGNIKTAWKTVCREVGISDATPHTLRHTSITWAMQRGARIEDASGFYGVSIETLQRVYWHHHPDYQESVHEALENRGFRG